MAFEQKTWTDRLTEYPTRRKLTKTDGTTEIVDVARLEGTISQEGDAFSAENMNDLEQRIADEFDSQNKTLANNFNFDNEVIIGTFNGKNVYRRTITTTVDSSLKASDIETLLCIRGGCYMAGSASFLHIPYMSSDSYIRVLINDANGVRIQNGISGYAISNVVIIIEYTKVSA